MSRVLKLGQHSSLDLGFHSEAAACQFRIPNHIAFQFFTLRGVVPHTDIDCLGRRRPFDAEL